MGTSAPNPSGAPAPSPDSRTNDQSLSRAHWKTNMAILALTAGATIVVAQGGAESFAKVACSLAVMHGMVHLIHRVALTRDPGSMSQRARRIAERYLDPRAITHFDLYAYWMAAYLVARHM